MNYDHLEIEQKWQKFWLENKTYQANLFSNKPKFYALDMFPYPSGAGLHVGHPEGFTATDIMSRYKRMCGFEVLHPMGYDAFGLPAEQYALTTNNDPSIFTDQNIANFRKQIQSLGFSYDWSRELKTTDPAYYKLTQWIFTKLYEKGLAELKDIEVNWCQELGTVLANEEILVVNGKMVSERGSFPVVKRKMKQWVLKITYYAERLLTDLETLDWPEAIKESQRNWIGKSTGANIIFKVKNADYEINVYSTRPETLFGAKYLVLSPEHELVDKIVTSQNKTAVKTYQEEAKMKTDLERTELNKEKTGVLTGAKAINPINNEEIEIYVADYVLNSYGTGAVMAVPAHDERDYQFAQKYSIDMQSVIDGKIDNKAQIVLKGTMINSEFLNGLSDVEAKKVIIEFLEENGHGQAKTNYKLRDWIFSRQRYWGEPFPIIHYENGHIELIKDLPVELPKVKEFKPNPNGEPPLANVSNWVNVTSPIHGKGKRETNVMPQWAGSCWYYIGYLLNNNGVFYDLDSNQAEKILEKWLPVDLYIGGAEHAVLHLLYARFWHKVLYDIGIVKTIEPFQKLVNQGMILGENGEKMSKSLGNVVNPDDIVVQYGADTLRIYEMFMGPLEASIAWSSEGLRGARKWLDRVWRGILSYSTNKQVATLNKPINVLIKKATEYIELGKYNLAISEMMIFMNAVYKSQAINNEQALEFLKILFVFAPHIAEQLASELNLTNQATLSNCSWPKYDQDVVTETTIEFLVQINGKKKAVLQIEQDTEETAIVEKIQNELSINLAEAKKVIFVKNKMVNIIL